MSVSFQEYSAFWILICIILAFGYSFLLYKSESKLAKKIKNWLFAFRFTVVFIITLFLFSPLITRNQFAYEKPIVLVAQDNSQSILKNYQESFYKTDYLKDRSAFIQKLSSKFDVKDLSFGGTLYQDKPIDYSDYKSDLSLVFKESLNAYKNRNLAAIVLASDGIHNYGTDPETYIKNISVPVYTVLQGDSVIEKDLQVKSILNNELVFLKNDFIVEIKINAFDLPKQTGNFKIIHKGKVLWKEIKQIESNKQQFILQAILNADEPGLQKYTFQADILPGESNVKNNKMDFYIDVIQNKQQIALIAAAPHPDLAAIKQSLENNENYKVDLFIADDFNITEISKYQLVILHQIPSSFASMNSLFSTIDSKGIPTWIILGNQNYLDLFNRLPYGLKILNSRANSNEVFATLSNEFQGFNLSEGWSSFLNELPPLIAPFGNYRPSNSLQPLFKQKIGNTETDQALLAFGVNGSAKYSILAAEGIWKWRIQNMKLKGNTILIDELCSKIVQYLSAKDDKRRFKVNIPSRKFDFGEKIFLNAELYNSSYELVNSPDVKLILRDGNKNKYDFVFSKKEKTYELNLGILASGEYDYFAETKLGNEKFEASGSFSVLNNNLEELNTTADFNALRVLSKLSGGKAFKANDYDKIADELLNSNEYKTLAFEEKKTDELINLKWIFVLLLVLLSAEWFIRKFNGLY